MESLKEKVMFSLFTRESCAEYRRVLLYIVIANLRSAGTCQVETLIHELRKKFKYPAEDVRSAVNALSTQAGLNCVSIYVANRDKSATAKVRNLCTFMDNPTARQYVESIEKAYPHAATMVA